MLKIALDSSFYKLSGVHVYVYNYKEACMLLIIHTRSSMRNLVARSTTCTPARMPTIFMIPGSYTCISAKTSGSERFVLSFSCVSGRKVKRTTRRLVSISVSIPVCVCVCVSQSCIISVCWLYLCS